VASRPHEQDPLLSILVIEAGFDVTEHLLVSQQRLPAFCLRRNWTGDTLQCHNGILSEGSYFDMQARLLVEDRLSILVNVLAI
jgi:hypothetical protein